MMRTIHTAILMAAMGVTAVAGTPVSAVAQQAPAAARQLGTIKTISGSAITLAVDGNGDVNVTVQAGARLLRIAPGQKDLKDATPIALQDLQPGDRVLVRGTGSATAIAANTVVVMKQTDIAEKQQRERQEWDRHGVGGVVSAVDAAAGTVTIAAGGMGTTKNVTVKTSTATIVRRYSPTSVRFDDAVKATLAEIKAGDQLRARGTRNADGTELTADEIVAGSFRNVAGLVTAVDPATQTITVHDLATKKPVVVKLTADSQMHKLPEMIAFRLAMRLKGGAQTVNAAPQGGGPGAGAHPAGAPAGAPQGHQGMPPAGMNGANGARQNGAPDLQQMLARMPALALADLKKGDAVIMVTTEPTAPTEATLVSLMTGVEPILTASPNDNRAAMLLSPWNLGTGAMEAAAQ